LREVAAADSAMDFRDVVAAERLRSEIVSSMVIVDDDDDDDDGINEL
jgi:hypothetical protein